MVMMKKSHRIENLINQSHPPHGGQDTVIKLPLVVRDTHFLLQG